MPIIDRALAFRLAGVASVDWRTAERFLRGEQIRGLPAARLRSAALELGLAAPVPLAIAAATPLVAQAAAGKLIA